MYAPRDWTECEIYRGCAIAIRNSTYQAFRNGAQVPSTYGYSRAEVRRALDARGS